MTTPSVINLRSVRYPETGGPRVIYPETGGTTRVVGFGGTAETGYITGGE
jgi:hypothetical protein